jgi:hypothetical protein
MSSRRCLFCLEDSTSSVSVEHIVPESLGNTTTVLPRGFVCDKCNNYFARKVEGPFLNSPAMLALRHLEAVGNKRGRILGWMSFWTTGCPAVWTGIRVCRFRSRCRWTPPTSPG